MALGIVVVKRPTAASLATQGEHFRDEYSTSHERRDEVDSPLWLAVLVSEDFIVLLVVMTEGIKILIPVSRFLGKANETIFIFMLRAHTS